MATIKIRWILSLIFVLGIILCIIIQFTPLGSLSKFEQLGAFQEQLQETSSPYLQASDKLKENIVDRIHNLYDAGSSAIEDISEKFSEINFPQFVHNIGHHEEATKSKTKIAYIFAGSARSFACPKVHWSIKSHLIDALGGDPYVFVRMSMEDNVNVKTGHGVLKTLDYGENDVNTLLKVLNPKKTEFFSFSDQLLDMQRLHPERIHTAFRENDLRRYSMFFHRCQAYKLALEYERENDMRFDWVVLVRVDAAWLEPILPIDAYMNDRVWVTETGYDVFNDQFMLIPRQFSDYMYDFNTKVHKDVYCLGGPDVEAWKCQRSALENRNFTTDRIELNLEHCCPDVLAGRDSLMGMSEAIHKRHLLHGKIPLSMARFPVFLTRRIEINGQMQCHPECFRIYALNYKEYLYQSGSTSSVYPYMSTPEFPDTRSVGISSRDRTLCYYYTRNDAYPWKPISVGSPELLHTTSNTLLTAPSSVAALAAAPGDIHALSSGLKSNSESLYHIDFSKKLTDPSQRLHPSILQNPKDTEVWRIHPTFNTEGCLTFSFKTKLLTWERCYDHTRMKRMKYDSRQLFFLYVLPHPPKSIEVPAYHSPVTFPDSTYSTKVSSVTRVLIVDATPTAWDFRGDLFCLTVAGAQQGAKVSVEPCSKRDPHDPRQLFTSVRTYMDGSNPMSTVGMLALASNPDLCVSRSDNDLPNQNLPKFERERFPKDHDLRLMKCSSLGQLHRVRFEFEMVLS